MPVEIVECPTAVLVGQKVHLRLGEPGTLLTQSGQRWHGRGVAIEVIPAHAIQDEQHHHSRSSKARPQNRQYAACRRRGHLYAKRRRKRRRDVLLRGWDREHTGLHRGPANISGIETS